MPTPRTLTLGVRDLCHFASAWGAAFVVAWVAAGQPHGKSALYALAPAAATVAFRQLWPTFGQSQSTTVPAKVVPVEEASSVDPSSRSAA